MLQLFELDGVIPLLTLRDYQGFDTLAVRGEDGADMFNVYALPAGPGTGRNTAIDGGPPSGPGKPNNKDQHTVYREIQQPPPPPGSINPGTPDGTIDIEYELYEFLIEYSDIEQAQVLSNNAAN